MYQSTAHPQAANQQNPILLLSAILPPHALSTPTLYDVFAMMLDNAGIEHK